MNKDEHRQTMMANMDGDEYKWKKMNKNGQKWQIWTKMYKKLIWMDKVRQKQMS